MNRVALDRRKFLRAVGATALTYPFLRSLPTFAQAAPPPRYLVLVFTPCGVVRYLWGAQCPTRGSAVVTSALTGATGAGAFRQTLMPLATSPTLSNLRGALSSVNDLTNQVILIDGLNVATADGTHEAGMAALWTAQYSTGDPASGKGMSIDQAIAQGLGALGANRPFASIELMVRDAADFPERSVKTRMIYNAADFMDPMDDPVYARNTVFQVPAAGDGGASVDRTAAIRSAVFNQLNRELTGVQSKLCTEDRTRLQNVQDAWNNLDAQLAAAKTAAAACQRPPPLSGHLDFPSAAKAQMDLAALALACDMTRVLSIQFSTATSNVTHTWVDASDSQTHHQHSHTGPSYLGALGPDFYDPATYNPPGAGVTAQPLYDPQLGQIDLWYSNQIAYLAQSLNHLNLLGQSVICWGSELDQGQPHNHDSTPFVLIGGGGGKLDTGKFVQFPLNLAYGSGNSDPTGNRFHNDLLLTLAHVMGVDMPSFGTTSHVTSRSSNKALALSTGPITEILKSA